MSLAHWAFCCSWVPYRNSPENALTNLLDLYANISNPGLMSVLMELAYQTHWHVFLLDEKNRQRNFLGIQEHVRLGATLKT